MKLDSIIAGTLALALATAAVAQYGGGAFGYGSPGSGAGIAGTSGLFVGSQAPHQPYVSFVSRHVASLSDEEAAAFAMGRGLGQPLPAERGGLGGPLQVLEFADGLQLTGEQRSRVEAASERMQARAREARSRWLEAEKALDQALRSASVDKDDVLRLAAEADRLRTEVRLAHLDAHLEAIDLLTPAQRQAYARLRGDTR